MTEKTGAVIAPAAVVYLQSPEPFHRFAVQVFLYHSRAYYIYQQGYYIRLQRHQAFGLVLSFPLPFYFLAFVICLPLFW